MGDLYRELPALNTSGEREDLLDQIGSAAGTAFDGVEDFVLLRVLFLELQELNGHHDGGQHVVKIVRDAAGQRADALQDVYKRQQSWSAPPPPRASIRQGW